jgi:glycosyltransferase involved in cell wall biosynthesis
MEKLSIIILTFNEEEYIEAAIKSASFADEILIVDSFSTDKTKELAQKYNVNFIEKKFENFSEQRYFAVMQTRNNMILFLDADERITDLLKEEIQSILKLQKMKTAYKILFSHVFMERTMKYGGYRKNEKLRLFNKSLCWYDESLLVHEQLIIKKGEIGILKHPIIHYTFRSWSHSIQKKALYAELQAQQLYKQKLKPNGFHFIIKPMFRFFKQYILKLGFLDGFPGFASAFLNYCYVMNRYVKLWLLNHNMK